MLSKTARSITIFLSLFIALSHPAFGGEDLTRDMAKEILNKSLGKAVLTVSYSQIMRGEGGLIGTTMPCRPPGVTWGNEGPLCSKLEALAKDGLIKYTPQDYYGARKLFITAKGDQYIDKDWLSKPGNAQILRLILGEYSVDEITGIRKDNNNHATVEYTLKLSNVTPFGNIVPLNDNEKKRRAEFSLYDDGWRLDKSQ